jgi:acyl dehydratase
MGQHGAATVALIRSGNLPPDLMTGLTLFLIARQTRPPSRESGNESNQKRKGAPGVSGRVWVRERVTYHRPIAVGDPFVVEGASTGRHIRKGRRYATTESSTHDSAGNLVATNLTTGLLAYRADENLEDSVEGLPLDEMTTPEPDWRVAGNNPHLAALEKVEVGEILGGDSFDISLAMMAARDTDNPDNPIHSDPEAARAAGLRKPIAGGNHVQAFAFEPLMDRWGPEVLLHGACVDTRWKAPTESDVAVTPRAEVIAVRPDRIEVALEVRITDGPIAMVASVVIPRPG